MPTEISDSYGTSTALTISLGGLTDGSMRQSAQVTHSTVPPAVAVYYQITTASATVDEIIEFFLARADDDGTEHRDGDTGTTDAAFAGNKGDLIKVHAVAVHTASGIHTGSFIVEDPGPDWVLVVANESGASLNATGSNHYVRYRTITPESQ